MNVLTKGTFKRDVSRVKTLSLLVALREKITQVETIIRGNTIRLVRFPPRSKIYKNFP